MEYIKPEESIILNVLSAFTDFTTCESICMSQLVDSTGQRTLAVVTKCDQSPDGLLEMLVKLSKDLQASVRFSENFLVEEIQFLEEVKGIRLPHFIPHSVFLRLLKKKVNSVSKLPINFVNDVWSYLENVCAKVLIDQCWNYPQLLPSMKKATEHVMSKMKAKFVERVVEMIEMEKITDYTCDPDFITSYNKLMNYHAQFSNLLTSNMSNSINVEGYGSINIGLLREVPENTRNQAFDLKMMMTAYWKIVLKRMVDCLALQLHFFIQKVVNKEMEIVSEVMGGGIEKMLNESLSMSEKRERFQNSIALLQESKETMEQEMDGVVVSSD